MGEVFNGVRGRDWLLAGVLTVLGAALALLDVTASDAGTARDVATGAMAHTNDSHSPWLFLFVAAFVPLLWWRRGVLVALAFSLGVMVAHDLLFGWETRCGAALPLAFLYAFLGALSYERTKAWVACALSALLTGAALVVDASAGPSALTLALPVVLIVFGLGRAARHRAELNRRLAERDEELRQLRDESAALLVADDRARLSRQLDGLLQERLDELIRAAESADALEPAQARTLLESIESDSRRTMDDMRDIVGLLRGGSGEVTLAPIPAVAHLDALLARHGSPLSRLSVSGDPRSLPATVELSAYRIVEYLVCALEGHPVRVAVRFADEALEIVVEGSVARGPQVRAAVARVRERAKLHAGSVDVKLTRSSTRVLAQLPVLG
jgi:signal transduction histidine kinase